MLFDLDLTLVFDESWEIPKLDSICLTLMAKRKNFKIISTSGIIPAHVSLTVTDLFILQTNASDIYIPILYVLNRTEVSLLSTARFIIGKLYLFNNSKFITTSLAKDVEVASLLVSSGFHMLEKMTVLSDFQLLNYAQIGLSSCDLSSAIGSISSTCQIVVYGGAYNVIPPKQLIVDEYINKTFPLISFQVSDIEMNNWINCISLKTKDDLMFVYPEKDSYFIRINLEDHFISEMSPSEIKARHFYMSIIIIISVTATIIVIAFISYWKKCKGKHLYESENGSITDEILTHSFLDD